ncbi:bifunctional diguanylate cyclase/phosphodiesterase [Pseudidiomarina sp. 1APR75-33.1]|uniref:putative bifunctional diguanylate cyclase/phosphodiesterase n=1 Tax=Pseudidiomarina terrestris TaxID=2820060 RepID=UPI00264C981D|nr:bifunctional diguanylate cyclase/phosphodiesterase [Pseudidiomarina sp. 1APR75-33.1]MDN7125887.1 bifunctional diguanylate cyclase/phosphodiesterase [Pseudidiomarina sp. 1APR75-33.1]
MYTLFSRSAATKFAIAVASFFIIIGLVGIVEFLAYQDQLLMALIPGAMSVASTLIGCGLVAVLYRNVLMARIFGAALLVLLAGLLWIADYVVAARLVALPIELVLATLASTASLFLFPPGSRVARFLWPAVVAFDLLIFVFLQARLWGLPLLPNFDPLQASFPTLTLVAILILFGALTLAILYWRGDGRAHRNCTSKRTIVTLAMMTATGFGVWYALTLSDLATASDAARSRITMTGSMIESTLSEQRKLAERMRERLLQVEDDETFQKVLRKDTEAYQQDFAIIRGFVIYNEQLQPIETVGYGSAFLAGGFLSSADFNAWLQSIDLSINLIISGASLTTDNPIFMQGVPVRHPAGELVRVVMLLDANRVIHTEYLNPFSDMRTYLQLAPDLLVPMGHDKNEILTEQQLIQRFPHHVVDSVMIAGAGEARFYSVLSDYSEIQTESQLNQLMLWLTFAFVLIYALAEDSAQRLSEKQDELRHLARHDDITGLLRRDVFNAYLQQRDRDSTALHRAIFFLNLDGFKPINDSLGHRLGDRVLAETAARIRTVAPGNAQLARFSGDEFVIYLESSASPQADVIAEQLIEVVRKPYHINNIEVHLTASVGAVRSNGEDRHAANMMQHAEIAMNEAKQLGGNLSCHFVEQMAQDYQRQVQLRNALQLTLDRNGLEVHYQPIYDTQTRAIVAVESLVRWREDDGNFISPAEFIPIAENTGQIIPLGEQVLELVLRDIHEHPQLRNLQVSVNVSAPQLQRYNFAKLLQSRLTHHQIAPDNLALELTEGIFVGEGKTTIASLQALRDLGCCVAIDDFGTGFSSLSYLNRLPADVIKIDRAFTAGLTQDTELQAVVKGIIDLCAYLGKKVVVEGIETEAQLQIFAGMGVQRLQGFYFARPMPLPDLLKLLNN